MQVFTVKEVAEYLDCSQSSIRSLVRDNAIPFFRIGVKLNFNKDAIDNWIHRQETQNMQEKERRYIWTKKICEILLEC